MDEIHDNLEPIIPVFFTVFDWIIVGTILLSIGIISWWIIRKRKNDVIVRKIKVKKFVPQPFLFGKELKYIEKLQEQTYWKDFSLKSTTLLKRILEHQYKMQFDFATGKEVQELMAKKKISLQKKQELKYFFQLIDPIKFAHIEGKEEISKKVIEILKNYNNYFEK